MKTIGKQFFSIVLFVSGFSLNLKAQDNSHADSIKVCAIVNHFYDWYLAAIKKPDGNCMPVFVKSSTGTTALDFTAYFNNLKKYHFSDDLIFRERKSYLTCMENLGKVKYADFEGYKDLSDYKALDCDFSNYYRWIGGQEPKDGIAIKIVQFKAKNSVVVCIEYYALIDHVKQYSGTNEVILTNSKGNWEIDNVKSVAK